MINSFSSDRDNYAFVTFFEHSSAAEAIESEFENAICCFLNKFIHCRILTC